MTAVYFSREKLNALVPPAGLEGYAWREGAGGGFWMARQDAYTGVMLFDK